MWHANTIRFILDTGQASPTHMGELRNIESHEALYYPSTFHALATVLSLVTGAAPTTAYTLSSVAAAVWLFPVSAASLTWQLLRTRTGEWRTAGAAATSAAMSASFTAIPYVEFDTASMPNLAAFGLAVPTHGVGGLRGAAPRPHPAGGAGAARRVLRAPDRGRGHRHVRRGVVAVRRAVAPGAGPGRAI